MQTNKTARDTGAVQVAAMDDALAVTVNGSGAPHRHSADKPLRIHGATATTSPHDVGRHRLILLRDLCAFIVAPRRRSQASRAGCARCAARRVAARCPERVRTPEPDHATIQPSASTSTSVAMGRDRGTREPSGDPTTGGAIRRGETEGCANGPILRGTRSRDHRKSPRQIFGWRV